RIVEALCPIAAVEARRDNAAEFIGTRGLLPQRPRGERRSAERRQILKTRDPDRMIESGSEYVEEIVILVEAAIDGKRPRERRPLCQRRDRRGGVQRDPFEKRLAHIGAIAVERQADPKAGGAAVRIGTGKSRERGHEDESATDRGRALETREMTVARK